MDKREVYAKLEKLRAFAERDCGPETENAIRIIRRLCATYRITDFIFTPYTGAKDREEKEAKERQAKADFWYRMNETAKQAKAREQAKREQEAARKASSSSDSSAGNLRDFMRVKYSYAHSMQAVVLDFIRNHSGLEYKIIKNVIYVHATEAEFAAFQVKIRKLKAQWQREMDSVVNRMREWSFNNF